MAHAVLRQTNVSASYENSQPQREELKQAFHLFNEMSQQLSDSYTFLENQVEQLSGELANVSAQRMRELSEKEQLAERLESLLQLLPAGVLVLDENGYITQSNATADELLLSVTSTHSLLGMAWRQIIQECFKPQSDDGHEISLVDGRKVNVRTTAMANNCGQLILLTDMTETRRLQDQLNQHERLSAMGKMAASLAHQIRTPLAAATLYSGHLASSALTAETRHSFAIKLQERLRHLENQVSDMLIFARGEAPLNHTITTQDLLRLLDNAMEVVISQHHVQCTIQNQAQDVELQCNQDALVSSLMNLINNALEVNEQVNTIRISACVKNHALFIQVDDDGPGLSVESMSKAAEPFYTTKANGTGLGLAVVQAVARAHNGHLSLHRSELGGLSATLTLPLSGQTRHL